MNQGVYPLAANMVNQLNRVDTISNNLANSNTVGFKQDRLAEGSFNHYLEKMTDENKEPKEYSKIINTIPKIDNNYLNSTLGSIVNTGNNLDFAISTNDSFFKVKDEKGDIQLTRNGEFKSLNGFLVTNNGYQVLDKENNPIQIDDGDFKRKIELINTTFANLDKIGNNNYNIKDQNKLIATENKDEILIQGSIEKSNVNQIETMVSLIEAQRRFEQAQKAISGIDDLNKKVIDTVGNGR